MVSETLSSMTLVDPFYAIIKTADIFLSRHARGRAGERMDPADQSQLKALGQHAVDKGRLQPSAAAKGGGNQFVTTSPVGGKGQQAILAKKGKHWVVVTVLPPGATARPAKPPKVLPVATAT